MAEVQLDRVRKVYDNGYEAVKDFSLDIADGEFVVLVGPSGCGKSTTLRMVAGLEDITSGSISIDSRIVNDVHPKDRDIAMVFQNYALYPHMTVYKNMAFALKLRGVPKDEIKRRVTSTAETLGIEKLLDRRPKQLSGGQRQRVAVGRAIVREPKAFLFDEPLSNLDAKLRVVTRGELKALHMRLRTTTIYVTHDQEEAMTLGDRVCVMEDGIIQQAASPFEVYQAPANRFVAAFIGTPPMNFFEGDITQADSELWFSDGSTGPDGKAQRIRILPERRDALSDYIGKQVVMGIRPQGFVEARFGDSHESAKDEGRLFHAKVNVVEPLGSEMDVHCSTDTTPRLTARVGAHQHMPVGEWATFGLDPRHVHYFEPGEFGINILASAGIDTLTPKAATT